MIICATTEGLVPHTHHTPFQIYAKSIALLAYLLGVSPERTTTPRLECVYNNNIVYQK